MTVEIYRSAIWVKPYYLHHGPLERALKVFDPITKQYIQTLFDYDEAERTLKIPKGVGLDFVKTKLEEEHELGRANYEIVYDDHSSEYPASRTIDMLKIRDEFPIRDEFQQDAIKFLLNELENGEQRVLSLDTGFGKTYCAIYSIIELHCPALIITRNLSDQWIKHIHKYTDAVGDDITEIVGSKHLEDIVTKRGFKRKYREAFYVVTIDTLRSFFEKGGSLQDVVNVLGIGVKIFDESHLNYVASTTIDVNMQTKFTWYLTATPGRSDQSQDRVFKRLIRSIPIHGVHTHRIKTYYNIKYITYNTFPSANERIRCETRRGFNSNSYAEYLFENKNRKYFAYGVLRKYVYELLSEDPDAICIVVLDRLKDIDFMRTAFENDLMISVGRYCTLVPKNVREKELNNSIILATIGSIGAGHDIKNLRAIHAFTAFSSSIITRQLLGRLREIPGKSVTYYDYVDEGFSGMVSQRKKRALELEPRAATSETIYLNVDDVLEELQEVLKGKQRA